MDASFAEYVNRYSLSKNEKSPSPTAGNGLSNEAGTDFTERAERLPAGKWVPGLGNRHFGR